MQLTTKAKIEFFIPDDSQRRGLPFFDGGISAGFPSPADDFKENRISLDTELVGDTEATFYARVNGNSMEGAGMHDGDLLVIDRSIEPYDGCIAVCFLEEEFTVKRIKKEKDKVTLLPENQDYEPIVISGDKILVIWGVVTYSIKNHKRK